MRIVNYKSFGCFKYESKTSSRYELGDVVKKVSEDGTEIGVMIQIHDEYEYRTDMFGNCDMGEITLATNEEIAMFRPELLTNQVGKF
jgi:hypothetical protein